MRRGTAVRVDSRLWRSRRRIILPRRAIWLRAGGCGWCVVRRGRGCRSRRDRHRCHGRTEVFHELVLFSLAGKAKVIDLVLKGDEQLGQVVVELGALLQVSSQLKESVVGRRKVLHHLFSRISAGQGASRLRSKLFMVLLDFFHYIFLAGDRVVYLKSKYCALYLRTT